MDSTRLKILNGAQVFFYENSFQTQKLSTLLQSLKISKGRFLDYFDSKEDLVQAVITLEWRAILEKFNQLLENTSNPLFAVSKFIEWRQNNFHNTGKLLYKLGGEIDTADFKTKKFFKKIFGEYLSSIMKLLDEAKRRGQLVSFTPTKELANFIIFAVEGGTMSVKVIDSEDQYNDIITMIKKVIRSYRDIDYLNEGKIGE